MTRLLATFFVLATSLLLTACDGVPDNWPAPDPGLSARLFDRCPNLSGHYLIGQHLEKSGKWINDEEYGDLAFRSTSLGAKSGNNRFPWGTVSITGDASTELTIILRRSDERIEGVKDVILSQRHSTPPNFGPAPNELRYVLKQGVDYHCNRGWLVNGPSANSSNRNNEIKIKPGSRITKDTRGGLVANVAGEQENTFSLWCGDGCKTLISFSDDFSQWGHWPAVVSPE